MTIKAIALAAIAALMLAGPVAFAAESETEILVSGDEPMNEGAEKEIKNPAPNAAEQAATQKQMDKVEAADGAISGKDD